MSLKTPKHRVSLWLAANAPCIALIPAETLYFSRQLSSGAYPGDADSIGLPIVSIGIAVIWQGSVDDLKLRIANRRLMGWLGLFVSGLCVFMAVLALVDGEFEPAPLLLAWAYIALAMRAAYLAAALRSQCSATNPV